jgi:hypothetical protein
MRMPNIFFNRSSMVALPNSFGCIDSVFGRRQEALRKNVRESHGWLIDKTVEDL